MFRTFMPDSHRSAKTTPLLPHVEQVCIDPRVLHSSVLHTVLLSLGDNSFMCTLDRREVSVDIDFLRIVLLLPKITSKQAYHPTPSKEAILDFLKDIGYDEKDGSITSHSRVDVKYFLNHGGRCTLSLLVPSQEEILDRNTPFYHTCNCFGVW